MRRANFFNVASNNKMLQRKFGLFEGRAPREAQIGRDQVLS